MLVFYFGISVLLSILCATRAACPDPINPNPSYPSRASVMYFFMDVCSNGTNSNSCTVSQWERQFDLYGDDVPQNIYGEYAMDILKYCTSDTTTFERSYMYSRCTCFGASEYVNILVLMDRKRRAAK